MTLLARILKRSRGLVFEAVPLVIGVIILNFTLVHLLPGDAAEVMAGESGVATSDSMNMLRARFGLDQPALQQLVGYFYNLAHFNLGFSVRYNTPILDLILSRLGLTALLNLTALVLALVVGVTIGYVMAAARNRWPDRVLTAIALLFYSTPGFWIGLMLIVLFSVKLGWLPPQGYRSIGLPAQGWRGALDVARHMVLPVLASSTFFAAVAARLTRASMIEVERHEFVRTAQAKGLSPSQVRIRHVLRNALIPLTTITGLHVGAILGGSVVVETIFGWPGLGRLAYDAVMSREYTVLLGVLLISSLLVILANFLTDLLQTALDPRIEA